MSLRYQGTINCAILESGIGGSGDPRRKWEEMGEREREREREIEREKCCFCLQNDLKEPKKCKKCIYVAWFTAFIAIIKKSRTSKLKRK